MYNYEANYLFQFENFKNLRRNFAKKNLKLYERFKKFLKFKNCIFDVD